MSFHNKYVILIDLDRSTGYQSIVKLKGKKKMAFDGITVAALTNELSVKLAGGRISKIAQPESDELILTIKNNGQAHRLLISVNASLPLCYLTGENALSPMTAPNFCMLLRKHIGGAKILSVSQPGCERVIRINLEALDEMGDMSQKYLMIELMGKYSNIIFCDAQDTIIDSIKRVSSMVSSVREVLPGRPYFIPNTQNKRDPLTEDSASFLSRLAASSGSLSFPEFVMKNYTGISLPSGLEMAYRGNIEADSALELFSEEKKDRLSEAFLSFMDMVRAKDFCPSIAWKNEEPYEFAPFLLTSFSDCRLEQKSSVSEMLEDFYAQKASRARIRQKSVQIRKLIQTLVERAAKKLDLQEKQLKDTAKREKYRLYGELLNTYGYECPEGAASYEVLNYYDNTLITIPLEPSLSASENAKKYYDRYTKLKRTYEALTHMTQETASELEHLRSVAASVEMAETEADLNEIRKELSESGYIRSQGTKARKDTRQKSVPFHFLSSDGFDIYVGRNNYQNDILTFKFAQGNDIWMHAKKAHGSHVILKTNGREVPDRAYEEAGAAAAWFSEARGAEKTEIDYIEKKHVKKPAGAKPGFVVYYTNYSLVAKPSIEGLTRLE